jgi:hypothetical protein
MKLANLQVQTVGFQAGGDPAGSTGMKRALRKAWDGVYSNTPFDERPTLTLEMVSIMVMITASNVST